jgi:hypothetical protein
VAITIVRLPQNANHATAQVNRTTWASAELLTASFVANAPALYTLCKRKEGSNPPPPPPHVHPKESDLNSEDISARSGLVSGQYELQSEPSVQTRGYSDSERGRRDPGRELHNGILVTSNIRTEYSPRSRPR